MRVAFVASKAASAELALVPGYVIEVCMDGPDPLVDARSYAKDHVKFEETPAYVYRVTVEAMHKYEIHKEVVGSAHTI